MLFGTLYHVDVQKNIRSQEHGDGLPFFFTNESKLLISHKYTLIGIYDSCFFFFFSSVGSIRATSALILFNVLLSMVCCLCL